MFNKRGIAPLVATLLLISFAISLGMVIMNFGRAQVELQAQCPIDIGLKIAEIGGKKDICYNSGGKEIKFTLENGVNIGVEGLLINVIGTQEAKSSDQPAKIIKGGTHMGKSPYDSSASGEIRQIKIIPKVVLYDEEQICTEKALVVESVGGC